MKLLVAQESPDLGLVIFDLHHVPVLHLLQIHLMLPLQTDLVLLERLDPVNNAAISHHRITQDPLRLIKDPPLVINCLVQFKQFLPLQCLCSRDHLRLLQRQRCALVLLLLLLLGLGLMVFVGVCWDGVCEFATVVAASS